MAGPVERLRVVPRHLVVDTAAARLSADEIGWLTTVTNAPGGQPQSSPVWFLWDGRRIVILSEPDATKMVNVGAGAPVSFHLEGAVGVDVVTVEGRAVPAACDAAMWNDYARKYERAIGRLGLTLDEYRRRFAAALIVEPTRVRVYPGS